MQDDHFSYKNCYQHGSKKKKKKKKLDLKKAILDVLIQFCTYRPP